MWRRRTKTSIELDPVADDFREWAANLPFVVERAHGLSDTVKMYAVDCQPLAQRSTWLVLDFAADSPRPTSISVLLPRRLAEKATRSRWGNSYMSAVAEAPRGDRVVFQVDPLAGRQQVEAVVLGAYRSVIDWT